MEIEWIRGIKKEKERYRDDPNDFDDGEYYDEKRFSDDQESRGLGWLCCW